MKDISTWETYSTAQNSHHHYCSANDGKHPTIKGKKHKSVGRISNRKAIIYPYVSHFRNRNSCRVIKYTHMQCPIAFFFLILITPFYYNHQHVIF